MSERLIHLLALSKVVDVGPVLAKNLISYCGGVEEIFNSSYKALKDIPGIGPHVAANIKGADVIEAAKNEFDRCRKLDISILSYLDDDYPQRLIHYKDAPIILFIKGQPELNAPRTIAIVGTRAMGEYGELMTGRIISQLKEYDVQIISGMAYGVDITAHRKCVQEGISTIGILGNGLDKLYPSTHKQVADKMLDNGGLISEFGLGVGPDREHFPMRNRVIAGMSDAVIVTQSKKKGGSMITADIAFNYNKDVFAIPGRVGDIKSEGCNLLIKWNKAALIQSGDDVARALRWEKDKKPITVQRKLFVALSEPQKEIANLIQERGSVNVDELAFELNKRVSQLAGTLLEMELNGVIKSLPGNRYILL